MDKITWDGESLRNIAALLRRASSSLDDCGVELRRLRGETQAALRGKTGALETELQRRMDRYVSRLDEVSENASGLAGAAGETAELVSATELSIRRMAESLSVGSPAEAPAIAAPQSRSLPPETRAARLAGGAAIAYDRLEQAADRDFQTESNNSSRR